MDKKEKTSPETRFLAPIPFDPSFYNRFSVICAKNGLTRRGVARHLIERWVESNYTRDKKSK